MFRLAKKNSLGLVSVLLLSLFMFTIQPVFAANEVIETDGNVSGTVGSPISFDMVVNGDGNDEITLDLYVEDGTFSFGDTTGLTFDGSETGNRLIFTGNRLAINSALATLTYENDSRGEFVVQATIVSGDGEVYNPTNGHVYQAVFVDGGINWSDANTAAEAMTYGVGGPAGYLATITTLEEDEFVRARLSNDGWMGASDGDAYGDGEGDWNWVGGPEAGTSFWSGEVEGSAVGDSYTNWHYPFQPDNAGDEDCGQVVIGIGGYWNDLTCTNLLDYYVVEFGEPGDLPEIESAELTITVEGPELSAGTCEELQALDDEEYSQYANISLTADIDCENQEIDPLFEETSFEGTFEGAGYTISNFVINRPEDSQMGLISAFVEEATITNLNLENVTIVASYEAGALLGGGDGGLTVDNVHARNVDITTTYEGYAGGLIGDIDLEDGLLSSITDSSATGSVYASGEYSSNVGGLIGMAEAQRSELVVERVYADVDVQNDGAEGEESDIWSDVGGLIGEIEVDNDYEGGDTTSITVKDVYSWGSVTAENSENVAGLIGRVDVENEENETSDSIFINIENSYARGNIIGLDEVGGLIGQFDMVEADEDDYYRLSSSFAMGEVTALKDEPEDTTYAGGLVGYLEDNAFDLIVSTDNYFDQTRTKQASCDPDAVLSDCSAVNIAGGEPLRYMNNSIAAPLNDWDFEGVWVVNEFVPPTFAPFTAQDEDNDGIPTEEENASPNNGDANNDGTPDSEQAFVASMLNPVTGKYAVLEVDEQCSIQSLAIVSEEEVNNTGDADYSYPAGFMDFRIDCGEPGFNATITQYYYDLEGDFTVRKFKPNPGYFTIEGASTSDQTIADQQVKVATYQVQDGSNLDLDDEVNGSIEDPAGLGRSAEDLADTGSPQSGLYTTIIAILGLGIMMNFVRRRVNA